MTPTLALVTSLKVTIATPHAIGRSDSGLREVIPITGGSMAGPLLRGTVLAGGADWCLTRPDGIAQVWARYTVQTDDGHLIGIINEGLAHPLSDGRYGGRTIPKFEVADGPLQWLRDSVFVGTLLAHASGDLVELDFYRVD